jgi:heterodisulfide reductase subunit A-like polyferredoxin
MEQETSEKVGAVLVVGGGVGGMQASLDLAEGGYKVYLVEKGPSIGVRQTSEHRETDLFRD